MLRTSRILRPYVASPLTSTFLSTAKVKKPVSVLRQGLKIANDLSKFKLSSLVVATTAAGFICAGGPIDLCTLAAASVGTGLCAASACTFNQVFEKDIDARMKRTLTRPLPSGKVSPATATLFGTSTGLAGVTLLAAGTNPVVAALGLGNIVLYAGPYTFSKRFTEKNTWIGAIVGAIPPVMGWLAATHSLTQPGTTTALTSLAAQDPLFFPSLMQYGAFITGEPIALATLLFLWQFPHFFALSWLYREDYQRGNFQMVACNDPTGARSAGFIWEYSLYLAAFPMLTSVLGYTSYMYSVEGAAANLCLLYLAHRFKQEKTNANARKIFICSILYLPLLLAGYVLHSRVWNEQTESLALKNGDEKTDSLTEKLVSAKEVMKGHCVHERLTNKDHLCAKIGAEKAVEGATTKAAEVVEDATAKIVAVNEKGETENKQ